MVNSVLGVPSIDEKGYYDAVSMGRHRSWRICLIIIHFSQKIFQEAQSYKHGFKWAEIYKVISFCVKS